MDFDRVLTTTAALSTTDVNSSSDEVMIIISDLELIIAEIVIDLFNHFEE